MVFDARKHAERSKRAREANSEVPQSPEVGTRSPDPPDAAPSDTESGLELNPDHQTQKRHAALSERTGVARSASLYAAGGNGMDTTKSAVAHHAPLVRSLLRVSRSEQVSAGPRASSLAQQCGNFEPATLILATNPVYPAIAKEHLISGNVEVQFSISPKGEVYNVKSVKGPTVLARAAIEAVETWSYKPAHMNGAPVDSQATTNFHFKLN